MRKFLNLVSAATLLTAAGYIASNSRDLSNLRAENTDAESWFSGLTFAQSSHDNANGNGNAPHSRSATSPEDAETKKAEAAARQKFVAQNLIGQMRDVHFHHPNFSPAMSAFSWTNYLDSLDYGKMYFTRSDIDEFEPYKYKIDALARAGDLTYAKMVFDRLHQRVRERVAYLEENYGTNSLPIVVPEFAPDAEFKWRRKDVAWPADDAEYEDVWSKMAANRFVTARVAGILQNEKNLEKSETTTNAPAIKTEAEMLASAAADLIKSYRQYLTVLDDSDSDFYATKFLNSITSAYDPHSSYLSPEIAEDFGIEMQLSLQGIGATLQTDDGAAKIMEILPGSPAARDESPERLARGDKIIAVAQGIDGEFEDIRHWPLNKAVRKIRGSKGSTVRLKVIPVNDINSEKIVVLVRDEIILEEQAAASRLETVTDPDGAERKLGYIRLPSFYASMKLGANPDATPRSASADIAALISELNADGAEGLILDLRGNGGGSLPEAVYTTGLFIKTGPVVQVKESRRTVPLPVNDPAVAFDKPLIILIDRLSASASEIVAGALQDYGRALIVGDERSHGKGTVQSLIPLQNGRLGSLKATTSAFHRINGGSTQIKGVSSDIVLPSVFSAYKELGEDTHPNALPWVQITPARFRKIDDLSADIPTIASNSVARLKTNEKWRKYTASLARAAETATADSIPLDYTLRLEKARADELFKKEFSFLDEEDAEIIADLTDSDTPAPDTPPEPLTKKERDERRRKNDVVLDEALLILTDLIDIHGKPSDLSGENAPADFFQSFFRTSF